MKYSRESPLEKWVNEQRRKQGSGIAPPEANGTPDFSDQIDEEMHKLKTIPGYRNYQRAKLVVIILAIAGLMFGLVGVGILLLKILIKLSV